MKKKIFFIQLPFPSSGNSNNLLNNYYQDYFQRYKNVMRTYEIKYNLWELPLWVAHLSERLKRYDQLFLDLSGEIYDYQLIFYRIISFIEKETNLTNDKVYLFFSPLTQNTNLCNTVAHRIQKEFSQIFLLAGGNMAYWLNPENFDFICKGILVNQLDEIFPEITELDKNQCLSYSPRYDLLAYLNSKVPLLRFNASHGCLNQCKFCGDVWSNTLYDVPIKFLEQELDDFEKFFPDIDNIYIGDKTFGQAKLALMNLHDLLKGKHKYNLIAQTTFSMINSKLVNIMKDINIKVVELGLETANAIVLKEMKKHTVAIHKIADKLKMLEDNGIKVILNVMGGLPDETEESMNDTIKFIEDVENVWLYNIYYFVPYPYTPFHRLLKERITCRDFDHWREDGNNIIEPLYVNQDRQMHHYNKIIELCHKKILQHKLDGVRI